MEDEINLKVRTEVLRFSLWMENAINTLLQSHLLILDKEKTKNFGNKSGIPFKSKIDLLYDIEILTKQEHSDLELLMNFRNKFLHDIESSSFTKILGTIDNGIKNRFRKFLNPDIKIEDERAYIDACENLYFHNLKILQKKYQERRISLENKNKYYEELYDTILLINKLSTNFAIDIFNIIEKLDLENPTIMNALNPLSERCIEFSKEYNLSQKIEELEKLKELIPKRLL